MDEFLENLIKQIVTLPQGVDMTCQRLDTDADYVLVFRYKTETSGMTQTISVPKDIMRFIINNR